MAARWPSMPSPVSRRGACKSGSTDRRSRSPPTAASARPVPTPIATNVPSQRKDQHGRVLATVLVAYPACHRPHLARRAGRLVMQSVPVAATAPSCSASRGSKAAPVIGTSFVMTIGTRRTLVENVRRASP